ncbi:phytoene desaturase family protein [Natrialbaceae archaeon AArc-T1-2]|uniref:phytoene desaturase family protein n=1 Tax=Natrialbaceae archaeon AArc-T1-2 TaxID=3053904 RepID=UPI00255AC9EB|nr:phytoene desaturase family protein [Natrialbaceae archaeon AArc-T1-2]WIV65980.1 phytoene desaturase family protein [Natrialbaceae archaeon AArc-T1-2]
MKSLAGTSLLVIGGGIGGLSTACYLADSGADVHVIEKNEQLGGRASRLEVDGFRFDMGPSWYLMPDVFERFFGQFDRTPTDYYGLTHLDPHYRIFFKDGDEVDITPDLERTKRVFESYEPGAGEALERYLETSRENYEVGMEHFVYEDRERLRDFLDLDVARQARGLSLLGSMQGHVENYFEHPKLQQIMQYTLVFLGGSPTNTPALYNLMSHVDFNLGVWYPEGGLGGVIDGIVELGRELGVSYETDRPATAITGRAGGFKVETPDGPITADLVVSNADYAHTEQELLPPEKRGYDADYWESRTYAPSAFLLYLGVEGDLEELAHHTLVLPTDWQPHFDRIFEESAWPEDPAYYLCVPSKTDETVAPDGHSNLFVLVPIAPGLEDDPERREAFRDRILEDVARNTGVDLRDRIVLEERFCVEEFASRYNSFKGSALGMAHTLRQTAPFRPSHRSTEVDGLYFVGSYTTPGIGVPMCLISGEHTAEKVLADHGS